MTKKLFLSAVLFAFLWVAAPATTSAQYIMTQAELVQLESNLQQASELISFYKQNSQLQKEDLTRLKESLARAEYLLSASQEDLKRAMLRSQELETSLQTANHSLKAYEKEMKSKLQTAKRQKNTAYIIAGCALFFAASR